MKNDLEYDMIISICAPKDFQIEDERYKYFVILDYLSMSYEHIKILLFKSILKLPGFLSL